MACKYKLSEGETTHDRDGKIVYIHIYYSIPYKMIPLPWAIVNE